MIYFKKKYFKTYLKIKKNKKKQQFFKIRIKKNILIIKLIKIKNMSSLIYYQPEETQKKTRRINPRFLNL